MTPQTEPLLTGWAKAPCLGCGEKVKRARDAWLEIMGTRSGSWLIAYPVEAAKGLGDPYPPPDDEPLLLLGAAHQECLPQAYFLLRHRQLELHPDLLVGHVESILDKESWPAIDAPHEAGSCPFCQYPDHGWSVEHLWPRWLQEEIIRRGGRFKWTHNWSTRVGGPTLRVCQRCNTTWMAVIENDVSELIVDMWDNARYLDEGDAVLLATWATMKAISFDAASDNPVIPRGFAHDLNIKRRPHRAIYVWLGAYVDRDGQLSVRIRPIYPHGSTMASSVSPVAVCITFTIVRLVFQILVPLVEGELRTGEQFDRCVLALWPEIAGGLKWPPPYRFASDSIDVLRRRFSDGTGSDVMGVELRSSFDGADADRLEG